MLAQASPRPLTVSAAISLTEALEDAATAYLAAGGTSVVFNFGGSNALARQIVNGAPADVFISADEAQMEVVENAQLVKSGRGVVNPTVVRCAPRPSAPWHAAHADR